MVLLPRIDVGQHLYKISFERFQRLFFICPFHQLADETGDDRLADAEFHGKLLEHHHLSVFDLPVGEDDHDKIPELLDTVLAVLGEDELDVVVIRDEMADVDLIDTEPRSNREQGFCLVSIHISVGHGDGNEILQVTFIILDFRIPEKTEETHGQKN